MEVPAVRYLHSQMAIQLYGRPSLLFSKVQSPIKILLPCRLVFFCVISFQGCVGAIFHVIFRIQLREAMFIQIFTYLFQSLYVFFQYRAIWTRTNVQQQVGIHFGACIQQLQNLLCRFLPLSWTIEIRPSHCLDRNIQFRRFVLIVFPIGDKEPISRSPVMKSSFPFTPVLNTSKA